MNNNQVSDRLMAREKWFKLRQYLEINHLRCYPFNTRTKQRFHWFRVNAGFLKLGIKLAYPIYIWGKKNAQKLSVSKLCHHFPQLPKAFDGLKILHLSDFHLDERPDMAEQVIRRIRNLDYDICVMTGDFFSRNRTVNDYFPLLKSIVDAINPVAMCYGILGNHDSCELVKPLEQIGIKMLINECDVLTKKGQQLQFIGTDDVHYFYTQRALDCLKPAQGRFTIALVHSPEIYDHAERCGTDLYLCGHTHGGQIRPFKKYPLITRLERGKLFYSQLWQYKKMIGYTSHGIGTSAIPIRLNTPAEIVLHELRSVRD